MIAHTIHRYPHWYGMQCYWGGMLHLDSQLVVIVLHSFLSSWSRVVVRFHGALLPLALAGHAEDRRETALNSPSEIDTRAFMWTFDCLDEDHELERFFSGFPGLRSSKVVDDILCPYSLGIAKTEAWSRLDRVDRSHILIRFTACACQRTPSYDMRKGYRSQHTFPTHYTVLRHRFIQLRL
jgi:hypothetical protein